MSVATDDVFTLLPNSFSCFAVSCLDAVEVSMWVSEISFRNVAADVLGGDPSRLPSPFIADTVTLPQSHATSGLGVPLFSVDVVEL